MQRYLFEGPEADLKPLVELALKLKIRVSEPGEAAVLRGLRTSLSEVKAIRQGKMKGIAARQLLEELRHEK